MLIGYKLTYFSHYLEDNDLLFRIWDFIFSLESKVNLKESKNEKKGFKKIGRS